ncbi:MAG: extracellular solute-binding protein [bacterium]
MANLAKSLLHAARRTAVVSLAVGLLFAGFGCRAQDQSALDRAKPLTLRYWRVFDDSDAFREIITDYQALHPNVRIEYRKFRYEEYEKELLNAIAEGRGPDVLSLQNSWLTEWQPRLLPSPSTLSMPFVEIRGSVKKEKITVLRNVPGLSVSQMANDFLDVVSKDAVLLGPQSDPQAPLVPKVYGAPLSVDTLAMFYNRDLLNANGLAKPASHWAEFQEQVKKITRLDDVGTIIQPAASIGSADNVERSSDLLAILMMQNGAQMTDDNGIATFDRFPPDLPARELPPAAEALVFLSDFANPQKEVYTWNDKMPDSLAAFASGKTAFFFGYAYHLPAIRRSNPQLNLGIAPLPQILGNQPVDFANYWLETVSSETEYPNEAWDFVRFATSAEEAQKYLARTGKPTALRSLVNSQLEDLDLAVFASQLPYSTSWYHGSDALATEETFREMIRQMHAADADPAKIVELGATKVNQTLD